MDSVNNNGKVTAINNAYNVRNKKTNDANNKGYTVQDNKAVITGDNGAYDQTIQNPSVKYGKDAINNYKKYIGNLRIKPAQAPQVKNLAGLTKEEFDAEIKKMDSYVTELDKNLKEASPINFEYKYFQGQNLDPQSLMAASHEELGAESISTSELSQKLNSAFKNQDVQLSAEACDLNKDGKIDLAEYSTTILLQDELSTGKIDGIVNNKGENTSIAYANKKNQAQAEQIFKHYYDTYQLGKAQETFLKDKNNLSLVG